MAEGEGSLFRRRLPLEGERVGEACQEATIGLITVKGGFLLRLEVPVGYQMAPSKSGQIPRERSVNPCFDTLPP